MDAQEKVVQIKKPDALVGIRHVQILMLCIGNVIAFAMRVNMSMAIVAMTDSNNEGSFDWNIQTQSYILSSFFWGYVILQIPGGEVSKKFGGSILVTLLIAINSVICLLLPYCAYYGGWRLVCVCRSLQGLSQGLLFPSLHTLIGKWVPLDEKSRLNTLVYAGCQLGTALQLMSSGFIADYWGWPAIFYVNGTLGAIWTALYVFLGAESPQVSRMISQRERMYIESSLGQVGGQKKLKTPWSSMMTSLPFIALILANCGQNWGFWTLMTEMPSYMSQVLGVNIKANGLMSALPYLAIFVFSFPVGIISDYILKKNWISTTVSRKIFNSIGHYGPAIALIGLSYSPAGDVTMAVTLLTVVVAVNAGHFAGYMLVHIDMAPNFAGTLMGITNGVANLWAAVAPIAAGIILQDETDASEWRKVFYLSSAVYVLCNTAFVIFGSSKRQAWNEPKNECTDTVPEEKKETA